MRLNRCCYFSQPKDVQESTPLHLAATYDHLHIAEVLLDAEADPQSVSNDGTTPLHEACLEGNTGIVTVLLEKSETKFGSDYARKLLTAVNDDGDTPLHLGKAFPLIRFVLPFSNRLIEYMFLKILKVFRVGTVSL